MKHFLNYRPPNKDQNDQIEDLHVTDQLPKLQYNPTHFFQNCTDQKNTPSPEYEN